MHFHWVSVYAKISYSFSTLLKGPYEFRGWLGPLPLEFFSQNQFYATNAQNYAFSGRKKFGIGAPWDDPHIFFQSGGVGDKHSHDSDHAECPIY